MQKIRIIAYNGIMALLIWSYFVLKIMNELMTDQDFKCPWKINSFSINWEIKTRIFWKSRLNLIATLTSNKGKFVIAKRVDFCCDSTNVIDVNVLMMFDSINLYCLRPSIFASQVWYVIGNCFCGILNVLWHFMAPWRSIAHFCKRDF